VYKPEAAACICTVQDAQILIVLYMRISILALLDENIDKEDSINKMDIRIWIVKYCNILANICCVREGPKGKIHGYTFENSLFYSTQTCSMFHVERLLNINIHKKA
jgi:hypothetical protein